jgi:hypothetical protein
MMLLSREKTLSVLFFSAMQVVVQCFCTLKDNQSLLKYLLVTN